MKGEPSMSPTIWKISDLSFPICKMRSGPARGVSALKSPCFLPCRALG